MSRLIGVNTLVFKHELDEGVKKQWEYFNKLHTMRVPFVEIRREYIRNFSSELTRTAEKAKKLNLILFYSVPSSLFVSGEINKDLEMYLKETYTLRSKHLKLTLGDFLNFTELIVVKLKKILSKYPEIKLSIENNQSKKGGSAESLSLFVMNAHRYGIPLSVTFDTGNFIYIGEVPEQAAMILADVVDYIHIKNVNIQKDGSIQLTLFDKGDIDLPTALHAFPNNIVAAIEYPCGKKNEAMSELESQLKRIREN